MQIALISDIHANFEALILYKEVLEEADQIICLGDLTGYYCQVNEVLDYVKALNTRCVLGNHDYYVLKGCPADIPEAVRFGIEYAANNISKENLEWLETLPLVWEGIVGGKSFLLCHGSPWRPLEDYLYADNPALGLLSAFDCDVIAFGQTHRPFLNIEGRPLLVNPGSIGQSRHKPGLASMALVETDTMTVTQLERHYDTSTVVKLAIKNGAKDWIWKHLR